MNFTNYKTANIKLQEILHIIKLQFYMQKEYVSLDFRIWHYVCEYYVVMPALYYIYNDIYWLFQVHV